MLFKDLLNVSILSDSIDVLIVSDSTHETIDGFLLSEIDNKKYGNYKVLDIDWDDNTIYIIK